MGGTYKVTDKISVFGGVRGVIAKSGYEGSIKNFTVNGKAGNLYSPTFAENAANAKTAAEQYAAAGNTQMAKEFEEKAKQAGTVALMTSEDLVLDCQQSGFGITPILGVDVNLGKLNLAAKYEFRTKINLKNDSKNSSNVDAAFDAYKDGEKVRSDIPALLTLGAQYSILDNVRVMGGFHYFFDKDAKGSATDVEKNTWEVTLGAEWDVNNWLTVSAGTQRTKYGFGQNMQDTNFNVSSTALCLGATFHVSKMVNINAGYMHSFYNEHTIERTAGITDTYTRKNDAVGVSVDLKF